MGSNDISTKGDFPNLQSMLERQASLEVQISEEIRKYNEELQRVAVTGNHRNTKEVEILKQKISSELSKATLEDNREKKL